jgi:CheY-like chemotaxis protein
MQKILLADDERDVRSLLQGELEGAGYRVTAVATGAEAVIAAADGGYDLYLLDMMMPGMNGVQTIQVLRKITPKIPILGLTGYTGQGYMAQASAYNVTCLAKPIDINDLLGEIKLKLANAARQAQPGVANPNTASRFGRTG